MAITQADEGTFADMEPMVEEGICTFKVFLAYKGVLMVTDDLFLRVLETHARPGRADDGPLRERLGDRRARRARARRRPDRPDPPRAHAPRGRSRPRPPTAPCGWPSWPAPTVYIVHVTCGLAADEIAAGQARGVHVSGETCLQYLTNTVDDLERPDFEGARYVCSPPLRERAQPGAALGGARPRRARERLDRPLPVQQRAEGARPRRLLEDPQRPGDDPAPAREAVGPRRRERAHHARASSST